MGDVDAAAGAALECGDFGIGAFQVGMDHQRVGAQPHAHRGVVGIGDGELAKEHRAAVLQQQALPHAVQPGHVGAALADPGLVGDGGRVGRQGGDQGGGQLVGERRPQARQRALRRARAHAGDHAAGDPAPATAALHERAIEDFDEGLGTYLFATAASHRPTM